MNNLSSMDLHQLVDLLSEKTKEFTKALSEGFGADKIDVIRKELLEIQEEIRNRIEVN